jgi:hypothetical protein
MIAMSNRMGAGSALSIVFWLHLHRDRHTAKDISANLRPANHAPSREESAAESPQDDYADIRSRSAGVSVIGQTPKSRLNKVESGSVLTLHPAAREINYNDTEAAEATPPRDR